MRSGLVGRVRSGSVSGLRSWWVGRPRGRNRSRAIRWVGRRRTVGFVVVRIAVTVRILLVSVSLFRLLVTLIVTVRLLMLDLLMLIHFWSS